MSSERADELLAATLVFGHRRWRLPHVPAPGSLPKAVLGSLPGDHRRAA